MENQVKTPVFIHLTYAVYFTHISYNCPSLGLWGYKNELQIKRAIKKYYNKLKG